MEHYANEYHPGLLNHNLIYVTPLFPEGNLSFLSRIESFPSGFSQSIISTSGNGKDRQADLKDSVIDPVSHDHHHVNPHLNTPGDLFSYLGVDII